MDRRSFLTGTAGLLVANQVVAQQALAEPLVHGATPVEVVRSLVTRIEVAGVYNLTEPELSGLTAVALRAHNEERFVDIWIGKQEGVTIAEHLLGIGKPTPAPGEKAPPPASQGLMAELVKALEGDVESVNISVADHGYHATIVLLGQGKTMKIDSRPGDAIGLALNLKAPIFVASALLEPTTLKQLREKIREEAAAVAKRAREDLKEAEAKEAEAKEAAKTK